MKPLRRLRRLRRPNHPRRAPGHSFGSLASRGIRPGFTLIELLIVVAILAVLAAIALPNFLEARTRATLGRARADLRALATALESYAADDQRYPPHGELLADGAIHLPAWRGGLTTIEFPSPALTTPIAYLAALPRDPFLAPGGRPPRGGYGYLESRLMSAIQRAAGRAESAAAIEPRYGAWRLYAAGPDRDTAADAKLTILYDPTNGTISDGDLVRSQRLPAERLSQDEH